LKLEKNLPENLRSFSDILFDPDPDGVINDLEALFEEGVDASDISLLLRNDIRF